MDLKQETSLFDSILVFMSSWNFVLTWVEHEKKFYNPGARYNEVHKPDKKTLNFLHAG